MYRKLCYGIVKNLFGKIFSFFNNIRPRYNLSLDKDYYDFATNKLIYCFKLFGDHSFVNYAYQEIKNNKSILHSINPMDLIKIVQQETFHNLKANMLVISEHLRNNHYKISDNSHTNVFSGEEICDNAILIERMNNIDLYKIAYNTGFIRGRHLTKNLFKEIREEKASDNVVRLALIEKNDATSIDQL